MFIILSEQQCFFFIRVSVCSLICKRVFIPHGAFIGCVLGTSSRVYDKGRRVSFPALWQEHEFDGEILHVYIARLLMQRNVFNCFVDQTFCMYIEHEVLKRQHLFAHYLQICIDQKRPPFLLMKFLFIVHMKRNFFQNHIRIDGRAPISSFFHFLINLSLQHFREHSISSSVAPDGDGRMGENKKGHQPAKKSWPCMYRLRGDEFAQSSEVQIAVDFVQKR